MARSRRRAPAGAEVRRERPSPLSARSSAARRTTTSPSSSGEYCSAWPKSFSRRRTGALQTRGRVPGRTPSAASRWTRATRATWSPARARVRARRVSARGGPRARRSSRSRRAPPRRRASPRVGERVRGQVARGGDRLHLASPIGSPAAHVDSRDLGGERLRVVAHERHQRGACLASARAPLAEALGDPRRSGLRDVDRSTSPAFAQTFSSAASLRVRRPPERAPVVGAGAPR